MPNPLLPDPGHRPGLHLPLPLPLPLPWRLGHALTLVLVALLAGAALAAAQPGARPPAYTSLLHPLWGGQQFGGLLEGLALAAALLLAALSRRHPAQRWWCAAAALALLLAWPIPFFVPYDPAAVAELAATPGPISPDWQQWLAEQALGQALRVGLLISAAAALALATALPALSGAAETPVRNPTPRPGQRAHATPAPARYHRLY